MRTSIGVLAFLLISTAAPARAETPIEQRVKILLTALGFDRTLAASPDYSVVVGVFGDCPTFEALQQAQSKKINGKPISVIKAEAVTYAYMERNGINVFYVCKITEADATILGKAAPRLGVAVLAENPRLVDSVAMMGLQEKDGHPQLLLNMKVARESKIELDPRIFGAAEIVSNN
jgi:hypothetical protein